MLGTLLPFSSLVSKQYPNDRFAAGKLFIDWLAKTNQTAWAMLPISPSVDGISPYASAGLGIDPNYGTLGQFIDLRHYAHDHGVELWGDLPFYLPQNSPLVKKYPQYFCMSVSAGSLKDKIFGKQRWDMPVYKGYPWPVWQERLDFMALIFDRVRLDAAARFFKCEHLSYAHPKDDKIVNGPGEAFFTKLINYSRSLTLEPYVENISGLDMRPLYRACKKLKVTTISVFTLFGSKNFPLKDKANNIIFTSTHDTPPVWPYLESLNEEQRIMVAKTMGIGAIAAKEMAVKVVEKIRRNCPNVIVAMQDWVLDPTRINVPSSIDLKNWTYQMSVPIEDLPNI